MKELPSQYDPENVEKRLYDFWVALGVFTASADSKKPKFCIMMPPPNVTGVLHMGHALSYTLEDILIRRKRMQGYNTLWLPGTDHAGIATQMVVERKLLTEEKISRHDLGREKFLERVWRWKEQSQDTILSQLKKLGCSPDWTRLRFTLDEMLSQSVREAFVRLLRENLIYRDQAIHSWCPRCRTALSDLEVKFKPTQGHLYCIRYLLKGDAEKWLTVATTRPETLLGDTAVAIHPDDKRYAGFHGKTVIVPLVGREVPVVLESYVDKEFGTGVLKITPAHDPNDYEIGKKLGLASISILDEGACLNEAAGPYRGLSREDGRKKVLEDLAILGHLEKQTPYTHNVGHCDRCGIVVEPRVSPQWFVRADVLAKPAIEAVESKRIRIVPEEWEKTYFEWMRNIRPWCISRQLWWGHRIPVWYCEDCKAVLAETVDPTQCPKCESKKLKQDEDVLDTWFSSGLWPFSTLGWPKETADMKAFYPTDVMETGFDILFFWVARMVMLGIKLTGRIPFHTVYLHPMVRDEYGQKMSKTRGNVKDPLEIIKKCGADALRFTLTAMAVHGRDVTLSESRIDGYRNFVNKIWNASRFVLMHFQEVSIENIDREKVINQWIWSRLNATKRAVNSALDQYRFFDAAQRLHHFVWHEYCDWFIEFIKSGNELENRKTNKESTAIQVLEEILRLLHPIMPFVTEELWQGLPLKTHGESITVAAYPTEDSIRNFPEAETKLGRVIDVVDAVRSKRGEVNLSPAAEISLVLHAPAFIVKELEPFSDLIRKLSRAKDVCFPKARPESKTHVILSLTDIEVFIPREDLLNVKEETERTRKKLEGVMAELARASTKLTNSDFVDRAPKEVVAGVRGRKEELDRKVASLKKYLKELG